MDDDEMTEIAAFWGSAKNPYYSLQRRLDLALAALEKMSKHVPGWDE